MYVLFDQVHDIWWCHVKVTGMYMISYYAFDTVIQRSISTENIALKSLYHTYLFHKHTPV